MKSGASDLVQRVVESGIAPSCAVGFVAPDGTRVTAGAGDPPLAGDVPPEDTFFDLASVTKPMTALAVVESGLDPARPLVDFLPELAGTASAPVPIELLLAHRAGLRATYPICAPLIAGGEIDPARAWMTLANARRPEAIGPCPPQGFPPLYSDAGYALAGEALARFVGARDAGEAIERLLVRPLGLEATLGTARGLEAAGIDLVARAAPTEIVGWRGGTIRGRVHDETAWALAREGGSGHAGMFGTAEAVLRFGAYVLGRIDSGGWVLRERPGGTLRAGFDGKSPEGSSAGTRIGPRAFGHLGFTGTSLWIDPDARVILVVLTNRVHPTRDHVAIRTARPWIHDALFELALNVRAG
ncbi:beta-lactamase family protein [Pendulispora brunnea]|uniref:Beta-lactamase family protein n=1 Tax=Pendulispora brunnea TaxID=2905690 RepID=A0ABZ2K4A2_9BACT